MKKINLGSLFIMLSSPQNSLSHRAVAGGFWLFILRGVYEVFYLLRIFILARILAPNDFGLLGIALLIVNILETFSTTGFQEALVQRREEVQGILDSAWTFMIIRGFVIFLILAVSAPVAATFFNEPKASLIIQVVALASVIQGFTNIGVIYFRKNLDFYKQFLYQFTGVLADFVVAVSLALIFKNIWALVFGLLSGNLARLIMSFKLSSYRPSFRYKIGEVKELSHFGRWVLGSTVIMFLIYQGDGFIVGKFLGAAMLGFYQMAYRISNTPATEITHIISQIAFPAYVKLRDEILRLKEAYLKILQLITVFSFPLATLVFALSSSFTKIVLGENWMPMIPAMRVLTLSGLARSIAATGGPIFYGLGKPKLDTQINGIRLILLGILIVPLSIKWSITGTALAVLVSTSLSTSIFLFWSGRLTSCRPRDYLNIFLCPVLGAFLMGFSIRASFKFLGTGMSGIFFSVVIGLLVYSGIVVIWEKRFNYDLKFFLKKGFLHIWSA
jgi:O-antigen/teichoic acid export membrane protein